MAMTTANPSHASPAQRRPAPRALRVGSVSFLNAKPLIYGLEDAPGVELSLEVPSKLLDGLRRGRYDVALLPVIDYQRMDGLRLLTAGGICCDGPTLTVRIFSPVPVSRITTLACDTDSHTSVALARILLAERYNVRPEFVPLNNGAAGTRPAHPGTATLLIGDKVVAQEPPRSLMPHQLDLGEEWKAFSGMPFVFAAWMARQDVDLRDLPARLEQAKRDCLRIVDAIIARDAAPRGWPADVARRYLTQHLQFDVSPAHLRAVAHFHDLAYKHGILAESPRPLDLAGL
jgi:chorismate dehydratase